MLRKIDDHTARQLPVQKKTSRTLFAALTATLLLTSAAGAHFAGPTATPVPYSGAGDPLALTGHVRAFAPNVDVLPASYVLDTTVSAAPYSGLGDPDGLTLHQAMPMQPMAKVVPAVVSATDANPLAMQVRAANARFADVRAALAEGYSPIPCTSGVDGGAMGIHYVNGAYLNDPAVEIGKPEAVMYEPQPDGSLELVAVEYITFKGPANLGGQLFAFNGAPNRYGLDPFYELHVWAFRDNPKGTFADMNPKVSCAAARDTAA